MDVIEIRNPPDGYPLLLEWISLIVLVSAGIVLFIVLGRSAPLIGATGVGILFLGVGYYRQYTQRPRSVSISDKGIVLHFHRRPDRHASWEDIKDIYSKPGPDRTKWGRNIGRGGIRLRSSNALFPVRYPIIKEIIDRYTKVIGRPPETWGGPIC